MIHRDDIDHGQGEAWAKIRDAAAYVLTGREPPRRHDDTGRMTPMSDTPGVYRIHALGRTHGVTTLRELAAVTRLERSRYGVEWPEDPGARHARRWD